MIAAPPVVDLADVETEILREAIAAAQRRLAAGESVELDDAMIDVLLRFVLSLAREIDRRPEAA